MSSDEDMKDSQLFAGFDDDEVRAFVERAESRAVPAGHVFFAMGDLNSSLFLIRSGAVKVERIGVAENIPLATLVAGETFGEMSFMDGSRTSATVTAAEATEVLEVSRETVDRLLEEHPALFGKLWHNFAIDLKQRLAKTNEMIDHYIDINQMLLQNPSFREYFSRL